MRIMLVHDAPERPDAALMAELHALGYTTDSIWGGDLALPERVAQFQPEVIIIATDSDARDTLEHVAVATQHEPRPIALFSADANAGPVRELLRRGVSAYVSEGFSAQRLKPVLEVAVVRFEMDQQWKTELAEAKLQLEERKWVERAKGIVMKKFGLSEDEAYAQMRRMAMDKNIRLIEIARQVVHMADYFV